MTNNRNLVITGFMGTGKSTVGRIVAEKLSRPFIDTDEEIVRRLGMSIPELFQRQGEQGFRHVEKRMCRFLAAQGGYVISTGGGMLVDESNRDVMIASGMVICLTASPEAIISRLSTDTIERPLLKGDWRGLLEKRRAAYDAIPIQIDTTEKSPEQVAEEIVQLWQTASV
ncbi:MAG: shikimate kinase [Anaerolineae bacterium]